MYSKLSFKNIYCTCSKIVLTVSVGLMFFSCSTQFKVTKTGSEYYPPREESDSVVIYKIRKDIPTDSKKIGKLSISCLQRIEDCDYTSVISLAEPKIKEIGGNALLITEHDEPSLRTPAFWTYNNLVLKGDVFLVRDFSSPPDTSLSFEEKYLYGGVSFGSETAIGLPKIGFYKFQERKSLETYYGTEASVFFIGAFCMSLNGLYGVKKNIFTFDTSLAGWWAPPNQNPDSGHSFRTSINPKIGFRFWKLWLKAGPSFHLNNYDSKGNEPLDLGKIGKRYYNFEILIKP